MDLSAELQACLKEFTADGSIEIRENGGRVAPFSGLSWEVRGAAEKPLLHLWSENYNFTRRVLAITDHSDQRLALAVERFGRAKPDASNLFVWSSSAPSAIFHVKPFVMLSAISSRNVFPMNLWNL